MRKQPLRENLMRLRGLAMDQVRVGFGQQRTRESVKPTEADTDDVDTQFRLIEMRAEQVSKFETAIAQLDRGEYGFCLECGEEIAEKRLRALPFAIFCKKCQETKEIRMSSSRQLVRSIMPSLFDRR